jgi:hypothetical protein
MTVETTTHTQLTDDQAARVLLFVLQQRLVESGFLAVKTGDLCLFNMLCRKIRTKVSYHGYWKRHTEARRSCTFCLITRNQKSD